MTGIGIPQKFRKGGEKRAKYGNQRIELGGKTFDSRKEFGRYQVLAAMERGGVISDLRTQVAFVLAEAVRIDGRKKPALRYVADFVYQRDGKRIVEDVKSAITRKDPVYRIKRHLLALQGIDITEV
jgi:hypothetical protein